MGAIEDIKKMRQSGMADSDIMMNMRQRGVSDAEINNVMSQSQIKSVVSGNSEQIDEGHGGEPISQSVTQEYSTNLPQGYEGMQPSMVSSEQQEYSPSVAQDYSQDYNTSYPSMDYGQYQPYQEGLNSEMVGEIAEQVAEEKLSLIRDKLESTIDFRNFAETKMVNLDERLARIEKILDKMQLAVLQKVGEYVNDVKDIKKELVETQKSFKALDNPTKK